MPCVARSRRGRTRVANVGSQELSNHGAVTWADARCLTVLSQSLSHRSVIFFNNRRLRSTACPPGGSFEQLCAPAG